MSAAWYIVLERAIEGFDHGVNGKSLARKSLDQLAAKTGVKPLMHFFSASAEDVGDFLDEANIDPAATMVEQWYSADEGLKTIQELIAALDAERMGRQADVIADLKEFEAVLERAQRDGVRWHLAVDY